MKKAKGITLIALVVTIIIMLVLAGVSLNAIAGDGGLIANAMRASFIQEMTAVQEAVDMWRMSKKFDDLEDISLPTEKIVEANTLEENKRLMGEVGYYRVWAVTSEKPAIDIKSDEDTFKSAGSGEIIFYPAGVQDLYYLDNEVLGLEKNNKKYLIDAQNSIIYSLSGVTIEGIKIHSLPMLRMLQGATDAPKFAEAEAGGSTGIFAGSKWLTDKDGHYIDENGNIVDEANKVINPNGFEIIADQTNTNVYKLYNNGDLYGKGVKGPLLNTSTEEMEKINPYVWSKLTIPSQIPGYNSKNIQIMTQSVSESTYPTTIYVIDSNKDLWAWGNNDNNKLGLNSEQLKEYTGMEPMKLNIGGSYDSKGNIIGSKKVYKVFTCINQTFVVTNDGEKYELYASGANSNGEMGTGEVVSSSASFKKVEFENPQNIYNICPFNEVNTGIVIICGDINNRKMYYAGSTANKLKSIFSKTEYNGKNITSFIEMGNGQLGISPTEKIKKYRVRNWNNDSYFLCVGENGKAYTFDFLNFNELTLGNNDGRFTDVVTNPDGKNILKKELTNGDVEWWLKYDSYNTRLSMDPFGQWFLLNDYFPSGIKGKDIKSCNMTFRRNLFFTTYDGRLIGAGENKSLGLNKGSASSDGLVEIDVDFKILDFLNESECSSSVLIDDKQNMYLTNEAQITFRENMLEQSWKLVAKNVKKFKATQNQGCLAYIDRNNDLWVAGDDSWILGLGTEEIERCPNFTLLKDKLKGKDIYNHIDGKVKDYDFSTYKMYILTNENDEYENNEKNNLYVSGHYLSYSWATYSYNGRIEDENCTIPTKILGNVDSVITYNEASIALVNGKNGYEVWRWGKNDGSMIGKASRVPIIWEEATELIKNTKRVDLLHMKYTNSFIGYIENNNLYHLLVIGDALDGTGSNVSSLEELNYKSNDEIIDFTKSHDRYSCMFLTSTGKCYGFGYKKVMGIGCENSDIQNTVTEINIDVGDSKIIDIAGGDGWYIVTTSDGRVFGTGANNYGILGRWKGVSRGTSNSRYKTAFEWVECPDLEI